MENNLKKSPVVVLEIVQSPLNLTLWPKTDLSLGSSNAR